MDNFPYMVILDKESKEEIPVITKEQIEQFKKDLEKFAKPLFAVDESLINHEEDWVYCKECLYYELGDCSGSESDEQGCYGGEKINEN